MDTNAIEMEAGDCFLFDDASLRDFGLILLLINQRGQEQDYAMAPVKLDLSQDGMDRFRKGEIYIGSFPDMTVPSGKTFGMMVFQFWGQRELILVKDHLIRKGQVIISPTYLNVTGETAAYSIDEFKRALEVWGTLFGKNGIKAQLEKITE